MSFRPTKAPRHCIMYLRGFRVRLFWCHFSPTLSEVSFFCSGPVFVADPLLSSNALPLGCVSLEHIRLPHCVLNGFPVLLNFRVLHGFPERLNGPSEYMAWLHLESVSFSLVCNKRSCSWRGTTKRHRGVIQSACHLD